MALGDSASRERTTSILRLRPSSCALNSAAKVLQVRFAMPTVDLKAHLPMTLPLVGKEVSQIFKENPGYNTCCLKKAFLFMFHHIWPVQ